MTVTGHKSSTCTSTSTANEYADLFNIIENINSHETSVEEISMLNLLDHGLESIYLTLCLPSAARVQSIPPLPCLYNCNNLTSTTSLLTNDFAVYSYIVGVDYEHFRSPGYNYLLKFNIVCEIYSC